MNDCFILIQLSSLLFAGSVIAVLLLYRYRTMIAEKKQKKEGTFHKYDLVAFCRNIILCRPR